MVRFGRIQRKGDTRCGVAELAAAGTDVAAYHEGGSPFAPTLTHVGAASAAANRVQTVRFYDAFRLGISFVGSYTYLEPFGFTYSHDIR